MSHNRPSSIRHAVASNAIGIVQKEVAVVSFELRIPSPHLFDAEMILEPDHRACVSRNDCMPLRCSVDDASLRIGKEIGRGDNDKRHPGHQLGAGQMAQNGDGDAWTGSDADTDSDQRIVC
jgi:hypothetical protein